MTEATKIYNRLSVFQKFRINLNCHLRRVRSNWLYQLSTALVFVTALNHASIYLSYGPDHPRCMQQWKERKQRGLLTDELLWKERLLYARRREFLTAVDGYGTVDNWKHPRATMGASTLSSKLF
ncbi:hypothetical protein niasHT_015448 [Heterodera trifolii]|uniref:Uncharacterized protein n=1 Tax=Heterodera trifolii TaxID=157864 RepID=A0ABD2L029_9BILA